MVQADEKVRLMKGKVAKIEEEPGTGDIIVTSEDVEGGEKIYEKADMVVLATGMVSSVTENATLNFEENGFILEGKSPGVYSTGVAKRPSDVTSSIQDATGVALKSIQSLVRS